MARSCRTGAFYDSAQRELDRLPSLARGIRGDGGRRSLHPGEHRFRDPAGAVHIVDIRTTDVSEGLRVHSVRDLTAQRRLEEELNHAQKMEAVGRLAGGVAHDFNNLLTVITCFSDMHIATLDPSDARREDVQEISKAARCAAALTGQLLAFSRKQILQPRIIDLNAIVADVDKMLRRVIGEDVQLVSACASDLWMTRADPGQIEQVLMNLAVNARDAMPNGGTLRIETRNVSVLEPRRHAHGLIQPGDYVALSSAGRRDATILVVEDDPVVRDLVRGILTRRGYTVLVAKQGEEAIALAERHGAPIHLLITDVVLPGLNGREIAERLQGNRLDVRVLFMSGYTDDTIIHRGVLELQHRLLQKPFAAEELERKVATTLSE